MTDSMRSPDLQQGKLLYHVHPESRIPKKHPLRPIKEMANACLRTLTAEFSKMYSPIGRPSIPPERLLKALLLQVLYSIRSERALVEHLDYNLLFRWFVGLSPDDPVWDASSFSKNRDRLIEADIAMEFLEQVIAMAEGQGLISKEHFTVDGTLLEAWASVKGFKPKDTPPPDESGARGGRNEAVDFHGEKRSNATHASQTDPEAMLAKKGKGKEAKLCYTGHALMENRSGLVVNARVTRATGTCEREAAGEMLEETVDHVRATVAADEGYDCKGFAKHCRNRRITPHVAQKQNSAIDGRTTRHPGYAVSMRVRKRVEEVFAWVKTIACLRKVRHRGVAKTSWIFTFAAAAYNLVRMRNLGVVPAR
jgi:transposase